MPNWEITNKSLECVPPIPEHISMPWDAADELLVNIAAHLPVVTAQPQLIIGDRYGAISTSYPSAVLYADNMSAALAIDYNRAANDIADGRSVT